MKYKVKVTVLDTKLYPEYQQHYCANPCSGKCPVYSMGKICGTVTANFSYASPSMSTIALLTATTSDAFIRNYRTE